MDMNNPRAYHTMVYSDIFNTIMVFGGENDNSAEIFDPLSNRWQLLPDFNIPRAIPIFYFDHPRGIFYLLFGVEGLYTESKYSDIIEFLDLQNVREGWNILDYSNKSEVDLKSLQNIYPINNDLILLYGGIEFRGLNKSVCVLNLAKSEINKIDQRLLETLRIQAKKNSKLSAIMSAISSKMTSQVLSTSSSRANI